MSTHNIYVIELSKEVLSVKKFREANPDYVPGKPLAYVGMTSRTPEERFAQHKAGYKSARLAKKYGVRLKPRQYTSLNPMPYKEAVKMEKIKTKQLRKRGWGVWSN
jgi:predicted GIY-YIG superfamily endonuclease